jgi:hypothetical protein
MKKIIVLAGALCIFGCARQKDTNEMTDSTSIKQPPSSPAVGSPASPSSTAPAGSRVDTTMTNYPHPADTVRH